MKVKGCFGQYEDSINSWHCIGCIEANACKKLRDERYEKMGLVDVDIVNEPDHYKHGAFETIDEMLIVFGPQKVYDYCIINAWKYRARAQFKGNTEQDLEKADCYLRMAREIALANKDAFYGVSINLIKEPK